MNEEKDEGLSEFATARGIAYNIRRGYVVLHFWNGAIYQIMELVPDLSTESEEFKIFALDTLVKAAAITVVEEIDFPEYSEIYTSVDVVDMYLKRVVLYNRLIEPNLESYEAAEKLFHQGIEYYSSLLRIKR